MTNSKRKIVVERKYSHLPGDFFWGGAGSGLEYFLNIIYEMLEN